MSQTMTIGQLATATGVAARTIRYYERSVSCHGHCALPPGTGSIHSGTSSGCSSSAEPVRSACPSTGCEL